MVGSVFQNPRTQFFNMDPDSEMAFGIEDQARPIGELVERVTRTAKDLNIRDLMDRNIFELSGGEKQKIAFASVFAMASIAELREHLGLIKSQGKTILIAEHRLFYLMDLVDRIVYLKDGRIAGIFTPEEFRRLPRTEREARGLRAIDLDGVTAGMGRPAGGSSFLELWQVSLMSKKRDVLHDIDLRVTGGEVLGIVGRNGSGKTALSRALCGLHAGSQGEFLWVRSAGEPQGQVATFLHGDAGRELRALRRKCGG